MFSFKSLAFFAALAGSQLVSAQSLSSGCQDTLTSLAASSDASCLNVGGLISIVSASSSNANASIVSNIDSWAKGLCSRDACTNATLATLVANVTSGCSSDLSNLGLGNVDSSELTSIVQQVYPTVRSILCLADTSNSSTLCVTETLYNLEPTVGSISLTNIESLVDGALTSGTVPSVPSNVTCTDCVKGAYSLISKNFGDLIPTSVSSDLSSTCGASFVDGSMPSSVTELASTSSAAGSSGAAPRWSAAPAIGVVAASLVAVSSAFALLA